MSHGWVSEADSPVIRRAGSADASQIISGINAICSEGGAFYTTRFVTTPQWESVLYHPEMAPDHMLAIAEQEGELLGAGRLFPGGDQTLMNHVAELGLFVLKPFRQRGIGTRLLNWLVQWAGQAGIEKMTLTVFSSNEPALQFFRKHHFVQTGRLRRQIKIDQQYIDLLILERFLQ
jgi:hypothetical protein